MTEPPAPPAPLVIEPGGASESACPDCGQATRTIWGFVHQDGAALAAYYVTSTALADHDAHVDLALGHWGAGATPADRVAIALLYRPAARSFMVIDAEGRPLASSRAVVGRALTRLEVIGSELAAAAFAIVDAVILQDPRMLQDARVALGVEADDG